MNDFFVHILSSHPAGGVSVLYLLGQRESHVHTLQEVFVEKKLVFIQIVERILLFQYSIQFEFQVGQLF